MGARASVFEDVGEGLLNDSVDHKPKSLGDHRLLPSHLEFNFHPGLVHQVGNFSQARGGGELGVGVLTQHPDDSPHFKEGLTSGLGDRLKHLGGLLRLLRRQCFAAFGLHNHDRQRVGDDVVELSGDLVTGALLGHPGLLFTFGEDRPVPLGFDDALLGVDEGGLPQSSTYRVWGEDEARTHRHGQHQ